MCKRCKEPYKIPPLPLFYSVMMITGELHGASALVKVTLQVNERTEFQGSATQQLLGDKDEI